MRQKKSPLWAVLIERGWADSRQRAEALILAGEVRANGETIRIAGKPVDPDNDKIEIKTPNAFVSRAGIKLDHAINIFGVKLAQTVCADVGACTGGFTEALLKHGAIKVYAIDVGYGELAWSIRTDPRVVVMERTNARLLRALPEPVSFVSVDVSFISLRLIVPRIWEWGAGSEVQAVVLVKPQFEAPRELVGKGGIVADPLVHKKVLTELWDWCLSQELKPQDLTRSPISGSDGNVEFLLKLGRGTPPHQNPAGLIEDLTSSPS